MRTKTIADDERVERFVEVATRFCNLIDRRSSIKKRDFVHQCAELLPQIQTGLIQLLGVRTRGGCFSDPSKWRESRFARWKKVDKGLRRKFGKDNRYHLVFDPYRIDKDDPMHMSLSDDLSDIYLDLRRGLKLAERGDAKDQHDAVWAWKLHFFHTGHHCVSAMRPLQVLIERYHEDD
jgi:hypothetical protein